MFGGPFLAITAYSISVWWQRSTSALSVGLPGRMGTCLEIDLPTLMHCGRLIGTWMVHLRPFGVSSQARPLVYIAPDACSLRLSQPLERWALLQGCQNRARPPTRVLQAQTQYTDDAYQPWFSSSWYTLLSLSVTRTIYQHRPSTATQSPSRRGKLLMSTSRG